MSGGATYEEIGRKFRDARLDKKLPLETASRALYIRTRYLQALEDGELEQLPGAAYVKGYIYHYARYLELNADALVEAFEKIGALPQRRFFYIPDSISRASHPSSQLVFATLAAALLIMLGWVLMTPSSTAHRARLVQPPPLSAAVKGASQLRGCVKREQEAWPPCYWHEPKRFSVMLPTEPLANLLQLDRIGRARP